MFFCLGLQQSIAIADDIVQAILIKRVMLQFQEILSIYKIEFSCEVTMAILIWKTVDLCFGQKYTLSFRLGVEGGGVGQDLDVGSTFRIVFSICE